MNKSAAVIAVAGIATAVCWAGLAPCANAQSTRPGPTFTADGVSHVPAFDLPPSGFMSQEAVDGLKQRAAAPIGSIIPSGDDISEMRSALEQQLAPQVQSMRERYPADVVEQTIAGVRTQVVTPQGRTVDRKRVLINVHGGGFTQCSEACAMLESLPIASVGGFKVITVDYRQAPESLYPAASEDVAAVYGELLKTHQAKEIGLYGCSAGGVLAGELAAWLPAHGLPNPGAIGIFGAGAGAPGVATGDSSYLAAYVDGTIPPPLPAGVTLPPSPIRGYFDGADLSDPLISPLLHPDVLAEFPPTLIVTGTRAVDLSPAAYTHTQLVKAGVPGDLLVGEGMSHCNMYVHELPESQDTYDAVASFFHKNLR